MSQLFGSTLRESPPGVRSKGSALLQRAGFLRNAVQGTSFLPLARRSLARIEALARGEMEGIGGQEVLLPSGGATELFRAEIRSWRQMPVTLFQIESRSRRSPVLEIFSASPGPEEQSARFAALRAAVAAVLARAACRSWKPSRTRCPGCRALSVRDQG